MNAITYDVTLSWYENMIKGPPKIDVNQSNDGNATIDFLGFKVKSRIGVAAGPLLDSRWIKLASDLGFDTLTYKTIRTHYTMGHPLPNIVHLEPNTISNSFGMPSACPLYLMQDIPKANEAIKPGQVVIISVTGSDDADFVNAALLAKRGGANIIEVNYSCPNISSRIAYEDVGSLTRRIVDALGPDIPVIVKIGYIEEYDILENLLRDLAKGGAKGVSGINGIIRKLTKPDGTPLLDEKRPTSGVCGAMINPYAIREKCTEGDRW